MGCTIISRPSTSDRFDPRYTVPTIKHPDSVMVWGAFSGEMGRAGPYFLPKIQEINGKTYIKVLEEHMLDLFHIYRCKVFMQDNAPCHKSKKVKNYLQQKQI